MRENRYRVREVRFHGFSNFLRDSISNNVHPSGCIGKLRGNTEISRPNTAERMGDDEIPVAEMDFLIIFLATFLRVAARYLNSF